MAKKPPPFAKKDEKESKREAAREARTPGAEAGEPMMGGMGYKRGGKVKGKRK